MAADMRDLPPPLPTIAHSSRTRREGGLREPATDLKARRSLRSSFSPNADLSTANHVPHVRISWDAAGRGMTPAEVVKALRDGEPSIGTRSEGDSVVIGVWMMQAGEAKIVSRRLRQELENHA